MRHLSFLSVVLVACGVAAGPSAAPPPVSPVDTLPTRAVITPEGGTFELGPGLIFDVPAGAVDATVTLTATEEPAQGVSLEGVLAHVRFEPADLVFNLPVGLTWVRPDVVGDTRAFVDNRHGGFFQPEQLVDPGRLGLQALALSSIVIAPNQPVEEVTVIAPPAQLDVLFVIDNSCSMAEEQALLQSDGPSLFAYFLGSGIDYHVGVTSTDTQDTTMAGVLGTLGLPGWIDESTVDPTAVFAGMVDLGTNGFYDERGRDAARMALDTLRDTRNAGFWRDDAALHIVFVSDEQDQSSEGLYDFRAWLLGEKLAGEVQVHAIVGIPGVSCMASDTPGFDYIALADSTGGATYNLCDSDWAAFMDGIGFDATGWERSYLLLHEADPATLAVTAELDDGSMLTFDPSSWTYDPATLTVFFGGSEVPPPGSVVRLAYEPL